MNPVKRRNLTSPAALLEGSDVPTKREAGLLLVHGRKSGWMPFLQLPMTPMDSKQVEPRFAGCKSVALNTKPRLLLCR